MPLRRYVDAFEALHRKYHRRQFVHPDPLEFLYGYENPADREVVGLIASSLAYGRVAQILRSVRLVLDALGPSPARTLRDGHSRPWRGPLAGFAHRFAKAPQIDALLAGISGVLARHGTLGRCFADCIGRDDRTVLPALAVFVRRLDEAGGGRAGHLLSHPQTGSACKRLNLYLRWMVRKDDVDPGGWEGILPAMLVVPLDVHMFRIGRSTGAIRRKTPDGKAALELTAAFAAISPADPVRYDFCLTRPGIRGEPGLEGIIPARTTAPNGKPSMRRAGKRHDA
ncbi:MAG: TIGR02757 family protein [Phycisphaerae bacterium]